MTRRVAGLAVRVLAGAVAALALLAGFLVWRLSAGPVSLDALAPYVARSLVAGEGGLVARIDHTFLSLGPGGTIEIVARGVHLVRRDGGAELALPELVMGFSPAAAIRGVLAPTRIILDGPALRLERSADGTFHLGFGTAGAEGGDWTAALLNDVASPPNGEGALGYLNEVSIRHAALTVDDRALGVAWHAKRTDAVLTRDAHGLAGTIGLTAVEPGGVEAELRGGFTFAYGEKRLAAHVRFAGLKPALFADAAPALAPLHALDLPLSGEVRVALDTAALRISAAGCDLSFGAGTLADPALEGGRVAIASGGLRAEYDPQAGRVSVERLGFNLGGPRAELSGTVDGVGPGILAGAWPQAMDVAGDLHLSEVPADSLAGYWPERLSPHSREWVTQHIHDGVVTEADARFGAHIDLAAGAPKPVRVDTFAGTFAYRGLTVDYFKPLEPLRGVNGTASFDRAHLDLVPSSGSVKGVQLTGGAAKLTQLDTNDEQIAIDFGLKGPLRDVLTVLDSKPLEYAHALAVDPARVAGEVDGQVQFAFPLKHDLSLAMVDFGAHARLSGVAVGQVMAGRDLSAGELQLKLDRKALFLDGTARLDGVPARLSWTESLQNSGPRARYTVQARLDDAERQQLGLTVPVGTIAGPVGIDATYTIASPQRATARVALDFRDAALSVAQLAWRKPAGVPARARLDLDLVDDHIRAVRQGTVKGGGLDAQLAMTLDAAGRVQRVDLPRLIAGETDLAATARRRAAGGWRVALKGLSLDASGLIESLRRAESDNRPGPPLVVEAALDRLILGPKREARAFRGQLESDGVRWQSISFDATMFGNGKASLRFGQAAGGHRFQLTTDDMGALLRLFDISDNVQGGKLEVAGQIEDTARRRVLRGTAKGSDYRVVHAPALARLLSVASLSGIGALLSGEGIPFAQLTGEFTFADGTLEVKGLRAYGGALGIKVDGVYDMNRNALDIAGTLVPAYTLNSVLGNIPLLGPLITGGEGEGIFAANFRVAGPAADPKVTVNPLSALAPGVLRKLFLFDAPEPSGSPASGSTAPK